MNFVDMANLLMQKPINPEMEKGIFINLLIQAYMYGGRRRIQSGFKKDEWC